MLLDRSGRSALSVWHARARCLRGVVLVRGGDVAAGSEVLRDGLDELRATDLVPYYTGLLGTMAQALVGVGQIPQGLATIDEALSRDERDEEFWCLAELLRIKAELLLLAGGLAGPGRRRGALPARPRLDAPAWSCAARSASPSSGTRRGRRPPRARCWRRSTDGSPRASPPRSSRRPGPCSTVSASRPAGNRAWYSMAVARPFPEGPHERRADDEGPGPDREHDQSRGGRPRRIRSAGGRQGQQGLLADGRRLPGLRGRGRHAQAGHRAADQGRDPGGGGSPRHHRSRLGREPLLHALEVGPARPSPCPLPSGERVSCLYPPVPPERVRVSGSLGSLSPLGRRPG